MRHKSIHLLHLPSMFKYVYDFTVSRVTQKIRDRIKVSVLFLTASSSFPSPVAVRGLSSLLLQDPSALFFLEFVR